MLSIMLILIQQRFGHTNFEELNVNNSPVALANHNHDSSYSAINHNYNSSYAHSAINHNYNLMLLLAIIIL